MKKILFVCTGNTCRSPMAQLIFNHLISKTEADYIAQSAGICTIDGLPISENSKLALEEIGIDADCFRSSDISEMNREDFEHIYAMTRDHKITLEQMGENGEKISVLGEGIKDPYGAGIGVYRICRDEIFACVKEIIEELCK